MESSGNEDRVNNPLSLSFVENIGLFKDANVFEIVLVAAILLGGAAVVQSFRAWDAGELVKSTEKRLQSTECRMSELRDELRRLEKEHARMCQKIVDFADALNE